MLYEPKPIRFRAVLWRGNPDDLPAGWRNRVAVREDGTAYVQTLQGPAAATPNGQWWLREGANGELYPIRADVFVDRYQAVPQ